MSLFLLYFSYFIVSIVVQNSTELTQISFPRNQELGGVLEIYYKKKFYSLRMLREMQNEFHTDNLNITIYNYSTLSVLVGFL